MAAATPQHSPQMFSDFSSGMSGATADVSTAMGEPEGGDIDPDIAALLESAKQSQPTPTPSVASDMRSAFESDDTVNREEVEVAHEGRTERKCTRLDSRNKTNVTAVGGWTNKRTRAQT